MNNEYLAMKSRTWIIYIHIYSLNMTMNMLMILTMLAGLDDNVENTDDFDNYGGDDDD